MSDLLTTKGRVDMPAQAQEAGRLLSEEQVEGLFDTDFYLASNPDIAGAEITPLEHFLFQGAGEARSPHPLFDPAYYQNANPDIAAAGLNPVIHFFSAGIYEDRRASPFFDAAFYRQQVVEPVERPLHHFLTSPYGNSLKPIPEFDPAFYLSTYPDIAISGMNALVHFVRAGAQENRNPNLLFNTEWYRKNNPHIYLQGINPLLHYLQVGRNEGHPPHPLFDPAYYAEQLGTECELPADPIEHYLTEGEALGLKPHPLFDPAYFCAQADLDPHDGTALLTYLQAGPVTTIDPHPLFDSRFYGERADDLAETGHTPLVHYILYGASRGLSPHPLFQGWWYAHRYLGGQLSTPTPLEVYLRKGAEAGHQPNPYFLTGWYRETQRGTDEIANGEELSHYIAAMQRTIRELQHETPVSHAPDPNPWFSSQWYLAENPDILAASQIPLTHYLEVGLAEGRSPGPRFNAEWYRQEYLAESSEIIPLQDFLERGAAIGRLPNPDWAHARETAMTDADVSIAHDRYGMPKLDPRQIRLLRESDLFDVEWYREKYLSPIGNPMDPIEHYLVFGANLGYNPSERFNTKAYRAINHDLRSAAINPLLHYLQHGRFEGRHATKEKRDNEVDGFRFSPPEYGPITDILRYDSDIPVPEELDETICIHLHLFHTDMAEEFVETLNFLKTSFTLLISVTQDEDPDEWTRFFSENVTHAARVETAHCENIGRDVQPWLCTFREIVREHDIFCHLHTKKSGYNKFQRSWRRYLAHTTFGAETLVNQIVEIFAKNPEVGLVFPAYFYILRNQPNYGKNYEQFERLYTLLYGDLPDEDCPDYPAGSFFWARTAILEPLFDLDLEPDDFDDEAGQVDGTIAHALERILGTLPTATGMTKRCVAVDIPFDLTRYIHPARVDTLNTALLTPPSPAREKEDIIKGRQPKVAVYTAITGGYENLVKPLTIDPNIDYFVFTDTPDKFDPDWAQVIPIPYVAHKPVRTARYAKTHPHFWFSDYDYAIWIDANVLPVSSLNNIVAKIHQTAWQAGFIEHPLRYNCMEEGGELIKFNLDDQALIEAQLTRYGRIPEIFAQPLIETNLFIVRPQLKIVHDFFNAWWAEINNYSHRDQLSVNYAILKTGLEWRALFENNICLRDHEDFFLLEHEMGNRGKFMDKAAYFHHTDQNLGIAS